MEIQEEEIFMSRINLRNTFFSRKRQLWPKIIVKQSMMINYRICCFPKIFTVMPWLFDYHHPSVSNIKFGCETFD